MRLFSYVVARDYGFAPNPFHGFCTLATCKPQIRKHALVGDYVVGITPKESGNKICYVMEVTSKVSFDEYWGGERFQIKKPCFNMSYKYSVGDNIYYRRPDGTWHQENSHHTHEDGRPIQENIDADTHTTDQVLISDNFSYWGKDAIQLPPEFSALIVARAHKCDFSREFVERFLIWYRSQKRGQISIPERWMHRGTFR